VLIGSAVTHTEILVAETRAAETAIGKPIEILRASNNQDIDGAFAHLVQVRADALVVNASNLFGPRRAQFVTLAAHHKMPVVYSDRPYTEAGGLMS
jgi:ABC-type uncharacterized transport system substrate-binding protein